MCHVCVCLCVRRLNIGEISCLPHALNSNRVDDTVAVLGVTMQRWSGTTQLLTNENKNKSFGNIYVHITKSLLGSGCKRFVQNERNMFSANDFASNHCSRHYPSDYDFAACSSIECRNWQKIISKHGRCASMQNDSQLMLGPAEYRR